MKEKHDFIYGSDIIRKVMCSNCHNSNYDCKFNEQNSGCTTCKERRIKSESNVY